MLALAACSGDGSSGGGTTPTTTPPPVATPAPTVTLTANPTTVRSGNAATLSWSASNATQCTASGGWSGTKATSGSQSTGSLVTNNSYTLTCSGAGGSTSRSVTVTVETATTGTADLSWIAPTTNTDDSPLTDLASFRIYHGLTAGSLQHVGTVGASELTYRVSNLASGIHYFAVTAVNLAGAESTQSVLATKTIP